MARRIRRTPRDRSGLPKTKGAPVAERIRDALFAGPTLYQTHTIAGTEILPGIRGNERRALVRQEDVVGKRVLDLGCATGAEVLWAIECGAAGAYGVDAQAKQVCTLNRLAGILRCKKKAGGEEANLRDGVPAELAAGQWDTVFCFSIIHHLRYVRIWEQIPSAQVVYVEGGADSHWTERTFAKPGWSCELLGWSPNNRTDPRLLRPLFRLRRS